MKSILNRALLMITLAVTSHSGFAAEGTGSSGGGTVVFLQDGKPVLTDLLSVEDIRNKLATAADANAFYQAYHPRFLKRPFVHPSGTNTPNYVQEDMLNCGFKAVQSFSKPFQESMVHLGDTQDQLLVELFQYALPAPDQQGRFSLPPTVPVSSTVPKDLQFPVARFYGVMIDLDNPLYLALSNSSRCGLGIHEWVRSVTKLGVLAQDLTTDEIEEFTRNRLGESTRNANILASALRKLNNPRYSIEVKPRLEHINHLLNQLKTKVSAAALHDPRLIAKIEGQAAVLEKMEEISKSIYFDTPEMNELINKFSKQVRAFRDLTLPDESQQGQLDLIFDIYMECSNILNTTGFSIDRMNIYLFERPNRDAFNNLYLHHLKMFQWFDASTEQVVTRARP